MYVGTLICVCAYTKDYNAGVIIILIGLLTVLFILSQHYTIYKIEDVIQINLQEVNFNTISGGSYHRVR